MMADIDYWRDAPLWDPESIAQATKTWFEYLEHGGMTHDGRCQQATIRHKIKTAEELARARRRPRRARSKVIMCHGMFDVVHPGHLRHLLYAKSKADILVASLTADAHITKAQLSAASCRRSCARSISPRSRWSTTWSSIPNPTPLQEPRR